MASIAGVRLPEPAILKGKPIDKRIRVLTKYARKVDCKTREGLDEEEALEFVRHWRPAFGTLKLLRSQPRPDGRRDLKLAVDYYTCQHCRFDFDEKDLKSICVDGVMCPKCGELVVKRLPAANVAEATKPAPSSCEAGPLKEPQAEGEKK